MSQRALNAALIAAAALLFILLSIYSGRTAIDGGLGPDGQAYASMVTAHDLQGRSVADRVWPAFPLATATVYAVTGNIVSSFAVVNFIALILLALAACLILDALQAPAGVKVCAVLTLALLGLPTTMTAYSPGEPYLLGVALVTLAVAATETGGWLFAALTHVAAAMASPVGVMAPLYGLWRRWRLNRRGGLELLAFVPALLVWLLVQVWARGGPLGLFDLLRVSRVRSDVVLWTESTFILFGAYFIVTTLGGLTLLLWSRPRSIQEILRQRPELWALVIPAAIGVLTAGLDVPPMTTFLIPFWLVVAGAWARGYTKALLVPVTLAALLTLLTQQLWAKIDDVRYFVDWFPYSVHAARVSGVTMTDAMLNEVWRVRELIAAGGIVAFLALWRRT